MKNREYKILKPTRYGGLIQWYQFLGVSGFILLFPAIIEWSIGLFFVSVALMGFATILHKLVRRHISAEELYSYGRKVLEPIPNDTSSISKIQFAINTKKGRHGSIVGTFAIAVWTVLMLIFAILVEKDPGGSVGPMILLSLFIFIGIVITIGSYNEYKELNRRKQFLPYPEIVLDTFGISIPTFILENGTLFNEIVIYVPWREVQKWEVCSGGDSSPNTYNIITAQHKYEMRVIRGYIKDEIAFLDAVRRIGQQEILLRTDDVE